MESTETLLDAEEYLRSLSVDQTFAEVYELDGASLFRIGAADPGDHFVILTTRCEHDWKHKGHELLRRAVPYQFERFAHAVNKVDRFEAHHYGPAL